ncbi:MAG: riboflavin synthase [Cyclobacteriaceae bacterium]|nr:riboflavin synthase [Cyclobacteriaceae bacterium]
MFTGIIEALGNVVEVTKDRTNATFCLESPISAELKIDQSLSHNGVCLTIIKVDKNLHWVTAVEETLIKSNLGLLKIGAEVNLERSMIANGRFDGHVVQGHVDQTAICSSVQDRNGSWLFSFEYDPAPGNVTVEKGSISVNGVSLTCFKSEVGSFSVAIIPYTYNHTNFHQIKPGTRVNLEFDIIGKYVKRLLDK